MVTVVVVVAVAVVDYDDVASESVAAELRSGTTISHLHCLLSLDAFLFI